MPQQVINIGGAANDGTGDPLRTAFDKINDNFSEIYATSAVGSNLDLSDNNIEATNTDGAINLIPNGTGMVTIARGNLRIVENNVPASSIGAVGDQKGEIAWGSDFIYVCIGNYNGVTQIWKRAPIAAW